MIYVTSDLHGYPLRDFCTLLEKAQFGEDDFLFVLGDVIDRNGDGGVEMLWWMMNQPNVELILGNHEAMLLSCAFLFEEISDSSIADLDDAKMRLMSQWLFNGGGATMDSLSKLRRNHPERLGEILDYLRDAPLYQAVSTESGDYLLVHSGLGNFYPAKKLREYTGDELLWHRPGIGERYFEDVTTVFGHTPTEYYGEDGRMVRTDTWIDIDTGASAGGHPMLLRLDDLKAFYAE